MHLNTSLTMLFSVSCVSSFCLADMLLLTSKEGTKILMALLV